MATRSSSASFDVAWRSTASARSARVMPVAVVSDANEPPPAAVGKHVDSAGAGIERVLDQLLHHARRTLDHLAGGDAVDDGLGKLADGHARLATAARV